MSALTIENEAAQRTHDYLVDLLKLYRNLDAKVKTMTVNIKLGDEKSEVKVEDLLQGVSQAIVDGEFQLDVIDYEFRQLTGRIEELENSVEQLSMRRR